MGDLDKMDVSQANHIRVLQQCCPGAGYRRCRIEEVQGRGGVRARGGMLGHMRV